jgi:hypothetical protein
VQIEKFAHRYPMFIFESNQVIETDGLILEAESPKKSLKLPQSSPDIPIILTEEYIGRTNTVEQIGTVDLLFNALFQKSNPLDLPPAALLEKALGCLNDCEGFQGPLIAIENFVQENHQIWDIGLSDGHKPLFSVIHKKQNQTLRWLIEHYPHLLLKTEESSKHFVSITPFLFCIEKGNKEGLILLHQKNLKLISECTDFGITSLHFAAAEGSVEIMEFLLQEENTLISKFSEDGVTPLHWAASGGHIGAMKFLLEKDRFLVEKFSQNGFTPLDAAACGGHVKAMEFLYENNTYLIDPIDERRTPLHWAAEKGQVDAGKWLYQQCPSLLNCTDENKETSLTIAEKNGRTEFIDWIQSISSDGPSTRSFGLDFGGLQQNRGVGSSHGSDGSRI